MARELQFVMRNGELMAKKRPIGYRFAKSTLELIKRNRKHLVFAITLFLTLVASITFSFDGAFEIFQTTFQAFEEKLKNWILLEPTGYIQESFKWIESTDSIKKI